MSNYWAIAIGINQYQNFKPLLYAQWDAQALWTYWIKEGGIPQTQCMLLTDSGPVERMSSGRVSPTLPNKKNIEHQLIELGHHRVGEGDTLWCFFSGYGLHHQGKDYLIPVDGNPNDVDQTGLSADSFFSTLKAFPTDRIIVLLDLKRIAKDYASQSIEDFGAEPQGPAERLGDDIAQHAKQSGIATILASQPDQLSHETLTLRQGLFTATLLEGLRTHGCFQLGQLTQYLENRLPELSEYHWRPRQDPLVIVSTAQRRQVLLAPTRQPATAGVRSGKVSTAVEPHKIALGNVQSDTKEDAKDIGIPSPPLKLPPPLAPLDLPAVPSANPEQLNTPDGPFTSLSPSEGVDLSASEQLSPALTMGGSPPLSQRSNIKLPVLGQELSYTPPPSTSAVRTVLPPVLNTPRPTPAPSPPRADYPDDDIPNPDPPERIPVVEPQAAEEDGDLLAQGLKYGLPLFAALMMLGVLWLNWPALTKQKQLTDSPDVGASSPVSGTPNGDPNNTPGSTANSGDGAIAPPEISSPVPNNANNSPENSPENSPGFFGSNSSANGRSGDALTQAKASIADGNYEDAAIWLNQVPVEAQTDEYERLKTQVDTARSQSGQANQEILDRAIASLNEARLETRVNQASDFGRAIAIAKQIQRGEPLYDEAQGYIARWGEVILDLAKSRAQSGEYEKAIATVSLIEDDLPLLYPKAQRLLTGWQQDVGVDDSSRSIINAAKADITKFPNQAFPYNRGIGKLRDIEPDDPLYGEAQDLMNEWSQQILAIAVARAQQGDIQHAIDTAQYVPQDTAAYQASLDAIEKWSQ